MTSSASGTPIRTEAENEPFVPGVADRAGMSWKWLAAIFVFALVLRWVYLRQIEDVPFFSYLVGDAARYWEWAGQIAGGQFLGHETFYQAPLYPYFLAALRSIVGDDLFTIRLVQAALAAVACCLLAAAACRLLNSRLAGILSGLLLALSPHAIFYGALIQKSVLDLVLSCALVWTLAHAQTDSLIETPSPRLRAARFVMIGLTLGLLTLSRENAMVLLLPLAGWIGLYFRPRSILHRATALGGVALGLAMVLLPVGIRNWYVGGTLALTTVQSGPNFYIGNHDGATGRYVALVPGHESPPFEREDARRLAERAMGRELTDREVSRYWMDQSFAFIRSAPAAWIKLLWNKWRLVWNRYEIPDTEAWVIYAESSSILRWLGAFFHFGMLVPLAMGGVVLAWSDRRQLGCLYAMILTLALATAAFYVVGRYRIALVPLLIVPAAAALARALEIWRGMSAMKPGIRSSAPKKPRFLVAALITLTAAVFCNQTVNPERQLDAMAYSNVGTVLAQQGALAQAAEMFRRAAAGNPGAAEPHYNLGLALAMLGQHPEAVPAFVQARAISPNLVNIDYNLAVSLERIGKTDDAIAAYRRAVQADPHDSQARNALERLTGSPIP